MKGLSSKRIALKVDVLKDRKIYCLQARPCIFKPGNFTDWGSQGVKMGSDENHFNILLIVRDKVTRQCPQITTFLKRRESRSGIEPSPFCLPD